jgi:hypothetical protein
MKNDSWLWDVEMDGPEFARLLCGEKTDGAAGLDADWALLRLIEYAPYRDLKRLLPRSRFMMRWPELAGRVRSASRREGMDYLFDWLKREREDAHE